MARFMSEGVSFASEGPGVVVDAANVVVASD